MLQREQDRKNTIKTKENSLSTRRLLNSEKTRNLGAVFLHRRIGCQYESQSYIFRNILTYQ